MTEQAQPHEVGGLRINPPDLADPGEGHAFGDDLRPILDWDPVQKSWRVTWLNHDGNPEDALLGGRRDHVDEVLDSARASGMSGRLLEADLDVEDGR